MNAYKNAVLRRISLAVALLLLVALIPARAGETGDERAAIEKTVDQYIEGGRKGSGDVMKLAFHDGATIYTAAGGGPIQLLYDLVNGKPPAGEIAYSIPTIEWEGDVAMARVEIDDWAGAKYTDMFTLVKVDGEWKIVSKVSKRH